MAHVRGILVARLRASGGSPRPFLATGHAGRGGTPGALNGTKVLFRRQDPRGQGPHSRGAPPEAEEPLNPLAADRLVSWNVEVTPPSRPRLINPSAVIALAVVETFPATWVTGFAG